MELLTPDRQMLLATWAIIQHSLPPPYHRSQEYEYELDGCVPIRLQVWKKDSAASPKMITLSARARAMMTPILEQVQALFAQQVIHAESDPVAMD